MPAIPVLLPGTLPTFHEAVDLTEDSEVEAASVEVERAEAGDCCLRSSKAQEQSQLLAFEFIICCEGWTSINQSIGDLYLAIFVTQDHVV